MVAQITYLDNIVNIGARSGLPCSAPVGGANPVVAIAALTTDGREPERSARWTCVLHCITIAAITSLGSHPSSF
jgi:hypothetical protein